MNARVDASDASGRERRTVSPCLLTDPFISTDTIHMTRKGVIGSQPVAKQAQCVHGEVDAYLSRRVTRKPDAKSTRRVRFARIRNRTGPSVNTAYCHLSRWPHLSDIVRHSIKLCASVILSTVVFARVRKYRYAAKRIVNIMKVSIERNNLQLELIRYNKKMLSLFTFNFANAYQEVSTINLFGTVVDTLGRLAAASEYMASK